LAEVPSRLLSVDALLSHPIFRSRFDESSIKVQDVREEVFHRVLLGSVIESLRIATKFDNDTDTFAFVIDEIRQWVFDPDSIVVRARVFFWDFPWHHEETPLPVPGAVIRLGTAEELYELESVYSRGSMMFRGFAQPSQPVGAVVDVQRAVGELGDDPKTEVGDVAVKVANAVLLAVRIAQPGWVDSDLIWSDCLNFLGAGHFSLGGSSFSWHIGADGPHHAFMPSLTLGDAEFNEMMRLIPGALHAPYRDALRVAITRFSDSYRRPTDYDRHLDNWMALESLIVPGKVELTQTLTSNIANLLYHNDEDRKQIRLMAKASYDLRGLLAHGSEEVFPWDASQIADGTKGKLTRREIVDLTHAWVRSLLRLRLLEWQNAPQLSAMQ